LPTSKGDDAPGCVKTRKLTRDEARRIAVGIARIREWQRRGPDPTAVRLLKSHSGAGSGYPLSTQPVLQLPPLIARLVRATHTPGGSHRM
jgi:hypothetical protein